MEPKDIRDLIELISRSNFSSFELEHEGVKIKLVKEPPPAQTLAGVGVEMPRPEIVEATVPAVVADPTLLESPPDTAEAGLIEVESPIVGTFYRSPSPDTASFVEVGGRVSKGQVICIVEAMKVMNEIESEHDAEVVEVVVANGQPVEFGEVLLRLRPMS